MTIQIPVANVGAGAGNVFKDVTTNEQIELKTIKAGAGISIADNASDITITNTGAGAAKMWWETEYINFSSFNEIATYCGLGYSIWGHGLALYNAFGLTVKLHDDYDGGAIKIKAHGWTKNNSLLETVQIGFKERWFAHLDNLDTAFVNAAQENNVNFTAQGNKVIFVSPYVVLNPDGVYAAGKVLNIAVSIDAPYPASNTYAFEYFTLRYQINLI